MIEVLFWSMVFVIVYTYVLFPLLVFLRGTFLRRPYREEAYEPEVSIVIAARNEAGSITSKLENMLSLDYPASKLEIIVASDGSEDETNTLVGEYAGRRVCLLALPRVGKAQALNAGAAAASGEILAFSDANSMFAPDALRALMKPFSDPAVGGVAGNQCYLPKGSSGIVSSNLAHDGEESYWNYDRRLKQLESEAGNVISATGSLYAIRRRLFMQVPEGVTDDFVTSTAVIVQGYRLVFAPQAVTYEPIASSSRLEFGRKLRISTRGLQAVLARRVLLNPFRYGFYAVQLFSHKVLRRLVALPLLVLLLISPLLWSQGLIYQLALLGQLALYALVLLGLALRRTHLGGLKIFTYPFYFCMVNFASLLAALNVISGRRIALWEPQRQAAQAEPSPLVTVSTDGGSP
jgi:cellulose synthase/poly-beta-1,6-N-acetylglucosamine synthase-like glycosyltransferase